MIEKLCRRCENYSICTNYGGNCGKYKLYSKDFEMWKRTISVLPYITIAINLPEWYHKSFEIRFGWIVWHGRLLWVNTKNLKH